MKNLKKLQQKRMDNKGFSLVELIIVIAIMAILVGIVGTQVIPYLNRSRESKDLQILDAFSTAAVSAYSMDAENTIFTSQQAATPAGKVTVDLNKGVGSADPAASWIDNIYSLTSYADFAAIKNAMSSTAGSNVASIVVEIDFSANTLTVTAYNNASTHDATTQILEQVVSHL